MSENNATPARAVNPSLQKPTAVYMFLGYFLWPFSLIGLAIEKEDDYIRFNCAQCFVLIVVQAILAILLAFFWMIWWLIVPVLFIIVFTAALIASYVFMIIVIIKMAKGESYRIPLVGDFSDKNVKKWFAR